MLQPVSFQDFSGGVADRYIGTDVTRAAVLDNFLIDETKKTYVRYGSYIFPAAIPSSVSSTRPTGIYVTSSPYNHPVIITGAHAYTLNESSAFTEITGANTSFLPTKTDSIFESAVIWRRQIIAAGGPPTNITRTAFPILAPAPQMIFCSSTDTPATYHAITLGLPPITGVTNDGSGSTHSYIYAFFYAYSFTDSNGTEFEYFGNPNYVSGNLTSFYTVTTTDAPSTTPVTFSNIPALTNNAYTNYDTASAYGTLQVQIYRTIDGGNVFFHLATIANGVTTYPDSTSDATIQLNPTIYTSGGVVAYDPPPTNVFAVAQTYDYFWYATPTALYQSVQGNPGAVPTTFLDQPDQKNTGLSDIVSFPILFCDRSVYRIEGTFDSFGNNGFLRREISKSAGCLSNRSIVKIPEGLVWFGNGGVWHTNGYQVQKISMHLDRSYSYWANAASCGEYDPSTNTVWWTISSSSDGSTDSNDAFLVLHLNYGLKPESVFSTQSSVRNIYPTALVFANSIDVKNSSSVYSKFYNRMLFTDAKGYLLWLDPLSTTDPLIDPTLNPASMAKKAVIYNYTTAGLDQGTVGFRKYTPEVTLELESDTNVALQIQHRRDDGGGWSGTGGSPASGLAGSPGGGASGYVGVPEIRQDGNILWGITDCLWKSDPIEHYWDSFSTINAKRSIPSGILRSGRRQMRITNSYTNISNSDTLGTATVNATTKTVTLDTSPNIWITDPEGYYITFAADSYVQTWKIKSRVSDTVLSVYDPYSLLASGSTKWVIKGFRKFERIRLLSMTLMAEVDGPTQSPSTTPTGANT